ncbi:MAG: N-acetylmuramoyl-L-alanine amidase [Chitinophagaceae bacterium]
MREIKYIVVHCTATPPDTTIESIAHYWKYNLGWKNPGYHYIIKRNGDIIAINPEERISNGVKGYNKNAVHISYIGGVDENNVAIDNRTQAQIESMYSKLVALSKKYPAATILGHRDFPDVTKLCPSFDVKEWLENYSPGLRKAA